MGIQYVHIEYGWLWLLLFMLKLWKPRPEEQTPCHSSFYDRDHLWSTSGSFAVQFGDHLRSGIICGAVQYKLTIRLVAIEGPYSRVRLGKWANHSACGNWVLYSKQLFDEVFVISIIIKVLMFRMLQRWHTFPEVAVTKKLVLAWSVNMVAYIFCESMEIDSTRINKRTWPISSHLGQL